MEIYYDPAQKGSQLAASALQKLMQPADVVRLPRVRKLLALGYERAVKGTLRLTVTNLSALGVATVGTFNASSCPSYGPWPTSCARSPAAPSVDAAPCVRPAAACAPCGVRPV